MNSRHKNTAMPASKHAVLRGLVIVAAALLTQACQHGDNPKADQELPLADALNPEQSAQRSTPEEDLSRQPLRFIASDGVALFASLYGVDDLSPKPLIIEFSPYGGASGLPDFGPEYNYIFVNARGTGQSEGGWSAVGPRDQQDIAEFLDWACSQPWSNGQIGLYGFSASAIAIYNSMHLPLACVDAAALMAGTNDLYRDLLYPGGIPNLAPTMAVGLGVGAPILASIPDRLQAGESPLQLLLTGVGFADMATDVLLTHTQNAYWQEHNQRPGPNRFPVLANTSFYDVEPRGPFESYKMLRDQGVTVHLRTLGAHDGFPSGAMNPFVAYQRWFDHYLLGYDNGVDQEPPVELLLGHGSYEALIAGELSQIQGQDWPLPGTHWQALHLDPSRGGGASSINDGTLNTHAVSAPATHAYAAINSLLASDPYTTAVIAPAGEQSFFSEMPFLLDLKVIEPLSLTYTSSEFVKDTQIVGPASLNIFVATTLPESDLYAVIADVWPDGSAHAVGVGRLRSSYPHIDEQRSLFDAQGEVVQPYPIHTRKDYALPGQVREYHIEFWPLGNHFAAGHRLRLYLTGAPAYALPAPGINFVSVGGPTASRLILPLQQEDNLVNNLAAP